MPSLGGFSSVEVNEAFELRLNSDTTRLEEKDIAVTSGSDCVSPIALRMNNAV